MDADERGETVLELTTPLIGDDGDRFYARACGRRRDDGLWEGWIEFVRQDGEIAVRTTRETTQPNRTDLDYWATGLTPVYLEGAFRRATESLPIPMRMKSSPPIFDGPAPVDAVLDPYEAIATGETSLRQRLMALAPYHLQNIVLAHQMLADPTAVEALTKDELVEVIVAAAVRRASAANA